MIVVKLTDDVLLAGKTKDVKVFSRSLSKQFKISKVIIDNEITFNGCQISRHLDVVV